MHGDGVKTRLFLSKSLTLGVFINVVFDVDLYVCMWKIYCMSIVHTVLAEHTTTIFVVNISFGTFYRGL